MRYNENSQRDLLLRFYAHRQMAGKPARSTGRLQRPRPYARRIYAGERRVMKGIAGEDPASTTGGSSYYGANGHRYGFLRGASARTHRRFAERRHGARYARYIRRYTPARRSSAHAQRGERQPDAVARAASVERRLMPANRALSPGRHDDCLCLNERPATPTPATAHRRYQQRAACHSRRARARDARDALSPRISERCVVGAHARCSDSISAAAVPQCAVQ